MSALSNVESEAIHAHVMPTVHSLLCLRACLEAIIENGSKRKSGECVTAVYSILIFPQFFFMKNT